MIADAGPVFLDQGSDTIRSAFFFFISFPFLL